MKKCAITIFHGLGDCVNATTLIHKIKKEHPACQITWITSKPYAGVVYNNKLVYSVRTYDDKPWKCDAKYGLIRKEFKHTFFPAPYYRPTSRDNTLLGNYKDILRYGHETIPKWKIKDYSFIPLMYNTPSEIKFVKNWLRQHKVGKYVLMETKFTSNQSFWNDKYTTHAVKLLNDKGYTVLLANEFKNFERYGNVIPLNLNYRFMPIFYNHSKGFIGVSSGISCINHTHTCSKDVPHLEFVSGEHWCTRNYDHKNNKIISFNQSLDSVLTIINKKI